VAGSDAPNVDETHHLKELGKNNGRQSRRHTRPVHKNSLSHTTSSLEKNTDNETLSWWPVRTEVVIGSPVILNPSAVSMK